VAVAIVQDWLEPETDRSTTNYDAINQQLQEQDPPEGMRVHSEGWTGNGFRIFEIWDSKEHFDRFLEDRLRPMLHELGGDVEPTPPTMTVYDLHYYVTA
jgi:hypothetical protein